MVFLEWFERGKVHLAMMLVGAGYGGYFVLAKASLTGGVDPFLFSTYRDGIGCLTLFLYALIFEREHWPKMTLEVAGFIVAMAIVGVYLQQTFFLFGLQYTNVIFSSVMMNCIPVWAFFIAVLFRVEEISYHRRDGQAKMLGILFCVIGATILTLYKGPIIFGDPTPMSPPPNVSFGALFSALQGLGIDTWRLGALCLLCCSLSAASFVNLQAPAMKRFPAPFTLMAMTTLLGTSMFASTAFFRVKEASAWILSPGSDLFAAIYAGIVGTGMCLFLSSWANHQSGPVLIAAYSPMHNIFSTVFGVIFLNSALFMGSVLGASSILFGLFLVIWGTREGLRLKSQIPTHVKELSADNTKPTSLLVEPLLSCGFDLVLGLVIATVTHDFLFHSEPEQYEVSPKSFETSHS